MTPQEISDHKSKWVRASYYEIHTHTDIRAPVINWCKTCCFEWRWDLKTFTESYTDTLRFELKEDLRDFQDWYTEVSMKVQHEDGK